MSSVNIDIDVKDIKSAIELLKKLGITGEEAQTKIEKAAAKAAAARQKAAEKAAAAAKKSHDDEAKSLDRLHDKLQKKIDADDRAIKKANEKRVSEAQRASERINNSFLSGLGVRGASGGLGTTLGVAIGGLISSAASAAVSAAVNAVKANLKLAEMANRVAISARKPGQDFANQKEILSQVRNTAINTPGVSSEGLLGGLQSFVTGSGGNLDLGKQLLPTIATVANATGTAPEEVGKIGAALGKEFDLKSVEEYQEALAQISNAAKNGSKTFAELGADILSARDEFDRFGLKLKDITALTTIAEHGGGSAKTVETMWAKIESGKFGNITRDIKGNLRDPRDILHDVMKNAGGQGSFLIFKERALEKTLGRRGMSAIAEPLGAYKTAYEAAGGDQNRLQATKAGLAAFDAAIAKSYDSVSDYAEVQKDDAQAQQSASAQLQAAYEKLQQSVGDQLTKPLTDLAVAAQGLIPALSELTESLAKAVNFITGILPSEDPSKKLDKAQAKLDEYEKSHVDSVMTPEHQKLIDDAEKANTKANSTNNASLFSERYARASGAEPGTDEYDKQVAEGERWFNEGHYQHDKQGINVNRKLGAKVQGATDAQIEAIGDLDAAINNPRARKGIANHISLPGGLNSGPAAILSSPVSPTNDNVSSANAEAAAAIQTKAATQVAQKLNKGADDLIAKIKAANFGNGNRSGGRDGDE